MSSKSSITADLDRIRHILAAQPKNDQGQARQAASASMGAIPELSPRFDHSAQKEFDKVDKIFGDLLKTAPTRGAHSISSFLAPEGPLDYKQEAKPQIQMPAVEPTNIPLVSAAPVGPAEGIIQESAISQPTSAVLSHKVLDRPIISVVKPPSISDFLEGKSFTSVQSLIDASPGNIGICIPPNTYSESITITKTIRLKSSSTFSGMKVSAICIFEGLSFKKGKVDLISGPVHFTSCTFCSEINIRCSSDFSLCSFSDANIAFLESSKAIFKECTIERSNISAASESEIDMTNSTISRCHFSFSGRSSFVSDGSHFCELQSQFSTAGKVFITQSIFEASSLTQLSSSVTIERSTFNAGSSPAISLDSSFLFSTSNSFCDFSRSASVNSINASSIVSESDSISGVCLNGYVISGGSKLNASHLKVSDTLGAAVSSSENSLVVLSQCEFSCIQKVSIQISVSKVQISDSMFEKCQGIGFSVSGICEGFCRKCKFISAEGVAVSDSSDINFEFCEFYKNIGGGISIKGSPRLLGCIFKENGQFGAEIESGKPIFENCSFSCNQMASVHILKGGFPHFDSTEITLSDKFGLCCDGGNFTFKGGNISQNGYAVNVSGGSICELERCSISSNKCCGGQFHGNGTLAKLSYCTIAENSNSVGFAVMNGASIECFDCKFSGSKLPHLEIRGQSKVSLKKCELYGSIKGIGIQINAGGSLSIAECILRDEQRSAIVVGNLGSLTCSDTKIIGCKECAITLCKGSTASLKKTIFEANGEHAIVVNTESASIEDCVFIGHSKSPIVIGKLSDLRNVGSKFEQNGQPDVLKA